MFSSAPHLLPFSGHLQFTISNTSRRSAQRCDPKVRTLGELREEDEQQQTDNTLTEGFDDMTSQFKCPVLTPSIVNIANQSNAANDEQRRRSRELELITLDTDKEALRDAVVPLEKRAALGPDRRNGFIRRLFGDVLGEFHEAILAHMNEDDESKDQLKEGGKTGN